MKPKIMILFLCLCLFMFLLIISEGTAGEGTIGTKFILTGSGFGAQKGMVYIEFHPVQGKIQKINAKVESWSDTSITCIWIKKVKTGTYPLFVQPKSKGTIPILAGHLTIMNPTIDQVIPSNGAVGDKITVYGRYFTTKKPNLYIENEISKKRKNCSVLKSSMDSETGQSSLQFIVPKVSNLDAGGYKIVLKNQIGESTITFPIPKFTWVRTGGPPGGLGYDIRYNFDNPSIWYVTDSYAGIHMSIDGGLTWFPNNQGITTRTGTTNDAIPIFCVTVDPHDSSIVWVGTDKSGDIYKSNDGGYSWTKKVNGIDTKLKPFLSFRGFTVDPRSSDIVYAMGEIGSQGWTPDGSIKGGLEMDMTKGIIYKTTDGGETWNEIWRGDNLARYCWIDPRNPSVLYVSTGIFDREAANVDVQSGFAGGVGILKSTDEGKTWSALNQANGLLDLYIGSLFMHPTNPDILLAAASQNNWSGYFSEYTGGVFLTENGGENWQRVLSNELFSAVEYCTSNTNIAYAASPTAFYRSEDRGHTWKRFARPNGTWGPSGIIAGFPIDLQCDPIDPYRIFVNNYLGGNFLSTDGGETWKLASQGYTGAQARYLKVAAGNPLTVYVGGRTGVFFTDNGGAQWSGRSQVVSIEDKDFVRMNEILAIGLNPTNRDHIIVSAEDSPAVLYSYDGGKTYNGVRFSKTPLTFAFAPSDPLKVYAGTGSKRCIDLISDDLENMCKIPGAGLYQSEDGGKSWKAIEVEKVKDRTVTVLAVHPTDYNIVYVYMPGIGIFKTPDGSDTWESKNTGLPGLPVLTLVINPSNPSILLAGTAGGGIYRTEDGGTTWNQSPSGINPNSYVKSIVFDPVNGNVAYAADFFSGVFRTTDGGKTWSAINNGLDHRAVNVLDISGDAKTLYASIEGAGVYRLDLLKNMAE